MSKDKYNLDKQYEEKQELYKRFCGELKSQINEILKNSYIELAAPIETRVKTLSSINKNIENNKYNPETLNEVEDLAGLRIVLLFKQDVEKTCEIITRNFNILKKENFQDRLANDQFGYGSIHFNAILKKEWLSLPTFNNFLDLKIEIQIRTAAQHIWATVSHLLSYKQKDQIPPPIQRSINRAAALLELVDLEFQRVMEDRNKYIKQIGKIDENKIQIG